MKIRILFFSLVLGFALPVQSADLSALAAEAAKYESGQSAEPVQKFEQLLRDSASNPALRGDLEAAMIKLLAQDATFEARRFACQQLGAIGTDASLPALAGLLKQDETVGIACLALGARRSPKRVEVLRGALSSTQGAARQQVIMALANQQDRESVKALAALASDADISLACTAIWALGKIGGAEAQSALAPLRRERKPALAAAVAEASLRVAEGLALAGNRQEAAALYEEMMAPSWPANVRRGAFGALLALEGDGAEKRILAALQGEEALLKPVAIAAAGGIQSPGASDRFAAAMPKLAPELQAFLIEALAARGDGSARGAIRNAAGSSDARLRLVAFAALGRLNDSASASLLCAQLSKTQDAVEREAIIAALAQLRGSAVDEAILGGIQQSGGEAKRELISLAGRRGNRVAVPVLLGQAAGTDPETAKAAFQALGKLATPGDLPVLLDQVVLQKEETARSAAANAAERVLEKLGSGEQRSGPVLARMTTCPDAAGRCALLRLLPGAGDAQSLAALEAALKDKDPSIRETAVRTLAAWPTEAPWDALTAVCRQPESATHRVLAFRGLVRMAGSLEGKPDAALLERYRVLLSLAQNASDSRLVLASLAGVASPDALSLALEQLANPAVQAEAAEAVKKIAAAIKAQHPQEAQQALQRLTKPK